jgi:hypothetical protein
MTQDTPVYDPWSAALDAKEPPQIMYGLLELDLWFCALVKGQGRVQFDPQQHSAGQRRTAISLAITPLADSGLTFPVERQFIAENRNDGWLAVTLPSIRALGITDLKRIHEAYVKAEMIEYGTYTKKDGSGSGTLTAPKILAVYSGNAECVAAYNAENGTNTAFTNGNGNHGTVDQINDSLGLNGNGNGTPKTTASNDQLKATALAFLPNIVSQCRSGNGMDLAKLNTQLASMPLVKDYFTATSPEVLELIQKTLAEPVF